MRSAKNREQPRLHVGVVLIGINRTHGFDHRVLSQVLRVARAPGQALGRSQDHRHQRPRQPPEPFSLGVVDRPSSTHGLTFLNEFGRSPGSISLRLFSRPVKNQQLVDRSAVGGMSFLRGRPTPGSGNNRGNPSSGQNPISMGRYEPSLQNSAYLGVVEMANRLDPADEGTGIRRQRSARSRPPRRSARTGRWCPW